MQGQLQSSGSAHRPGSLGVPHHVHAPRIKLLSDLHRPLEEHWAGKTGVKKGGKGLDAIGSDYTYKHHITRLEEIYTSDHQDPALGLGVNDDPLLKPTNVSPQAQLYGINGLLSPHLQQGFHEWKDKRESGWNPYLRVEQRPLYLDKVSALSEKRVPPPRVLPQRSPKQASPGRPGSASAAASPVGPSARAGAAASVSAGARFPSPIDQRGPAPQQSQQAGHPSPSAYPSPSSSSLRARPPRTCAR